MGTWPGLAGWLQPVEIARGVELLGATCAVRPPYYTRNFVAEWPLPRRRYAHSTGDDPKLGRDGEGFAKGCCRVRNVM